MPPAIRLKVDSLATGGRGVARDPDGMVWFLPRTVPGDEVHALPAVRRNRFVEGRVVRIDRPSPSRRPCPCPIQADCGGCPWMVLAESEQHEPVWCEAGHVEPQAASACSEQRRSERAVEDRLHLSARTPFIVGRQT